MGSVVMLSKKTFTIDNFKILNKNLNVTPAFKTNKQKITIEMQSFFRLVKLKPRFKDQYNEKLNMEDQIFKPQSDKKWNQIKAITSSKHILKQQEEKFNNKGYNNLSNGERIAMKELSDHSDIIITKADKGGAVVIMDVKDYVIEAHRQLNNKDDYKILNKDPTTANAKLVNDTIQRFKKEKLLKEKITDGLKVSNAKTPKFYMQPKIQKRLTLVDQ